VTSTSVCSAAAFPVQIIWGEADPALKVTTFGEIARRAAGVDHIHRLPGKHPRKLGQSGQQCVPYAQGPDSLDAT
jgi:hypothetical protein